MLRKILLLMLFTLVYYSVSLLLNNHITFFDNYARWGIAVMLLSGFLQIYIAHFAFQDKKFQGAGIPLLTAARIVPALIYFALPYFTEIAVNEHFVVFFILTYFIFMAFEIYLILSKLRPENTTQF